MRNRFQMIRVHATTIATQMIEFCAIRDLSPEMLVDNRMCVAVSSPTNIDVSVARRYLCPIPFPAAGIDLPHTIECSFYWRSSHVLALA